MKECEEKNEVLTPLVKILKYQEYCEWILQKDVEDLYLVLDKNGLCWFYEGLVEKAHSVVVELDLNAVIEVRIDSHELLRVNGESVKGIEHNVVLNSDDGERWEGDVLHNKPYGWGVLYDRENRMTYEGFRIGRVNVCYGRSYYSDIGVIEYEGEWFAGKRWGRGVHYDKRGAVMHDGEWMDDEQLGNALILNDDTQFIHNHIMALFVGNGNCNGQEWSVLDVSFMPNLRVLGVGDRCFENVKEVKLIGLSQLEAVVVKTNSFTKYADSIDCDANRHFYVKNCEKLKVIEIGIDSFSDYSVCEIENNPSLEVIEMGEMGWVSNVFHFASLTLNSNPP